MPTAKGSFTIDAWDQGDSTSSGVTKIAPARVRKTFSGDIEGTSETDILTAVAEAGAMAYAGFERLDVTIAGRHGGFVLHHNATAHGPEQHTSWTILAGSGTGELEGIAGTAEIINLPDGGHDFVLDYTLP
jgi:hypothetical protein